MTILTRKVLWHSKHRDEVYRKARQLRPKHSAIVYTGTLPEGMVIVPRIMLEKIEAPEQERQCFPVLCHTLPSSAMVDGVLGLDFFRGPRLIVDFRMGIVMVK